MTLKKFDYLEKIHQAYLVAVIRGSDSENAYQIAKACLNGGISAIELAFTTPNADDAIKQLNHDYADHATIIIGAGTVLDSETARIAILAGAKFIVSPSFDLDTARLCNRYSIPYLPGVFSPT